METPEIQLEKGPLPQDLIEEIATYRRLAFTQNDPNLAIYPSTGELIPQETPVTQEDLDDIDSGSLPFKNGEQAVILRGRKQMKEMMELYMSRESSVAAIAREERKVIGIALGCNSNINELHDQEWKYEYPYLNDPIGEFGSIEQVRALFSEIDSDKPLFFYSNLIVSNNHRGKGIGAGCNEALLSLASSMPNRPENIVFDTNNLSKLPIFSKMDSIKRIDYLSGSDICLTSFDEVMKELEDSPKAF